MKRAACLLLILASSACGRDPSAVSSKAYLHWRDRFEAATGLPLFGLGGPCMRWKQDKAGGFYESLPTDQCVKLDPPRRWKGLWRTGFEQSIFCPSPATKCVGVDRARRTAPQTWLGVTMTVPGSGLYAVDFIGRRTTFGGRYGHMGMSDDELIVDRMIAIRKVGPGV